MKGWDKFAPTVFPYTQAETWYLYAWQHIRFLTPPPYNVETYTEDCLGGKGGVSKMY